MTEQQGLTTHGLSVTYGEHRAVDGVNLTVDPGTIAAIVGPSGSGKSSLLGAIAGIVPSTGDVRWNGESLSDVPVHRRGVGLVFQDGQLFPHRDVAGNIGFGLEMARMSAPRRAHRVAELLDLVGLDGYGARRIDQLSGGERQRVALARSLAPSPRILLLDEPLSSLDAQLRERLAVQVRDILTAVGTTALVVTHDAAEARVMASKTWRMEDGHLTALG